jgi:zinc protease
MDSERFIKGILMAHKARLAFSIVFVSVLFIILSISSASFAQEKLGDNVYETTLANGLKVILLEIHKAPVVTVQVWYRVGSRNEAWGKTGLSHLLEHMMFKGSKHFSAEQFVRIIEENGGNNNAFTSHDYTAYFVNMSADRVAIPLELEADRMGNAIFAEKDFLTEKKVVIGERRLRTEDNPQSYMEEQTLATAYQVHPYHWPIIGWMEDLERLALADAREYYNRYYTPTNAFLIIAGDFSRQELLPRIEKAFGHLPATKAPDQSVGREPSQRGERRVVVKREGLIPALTMGYHVPNLRNPDSYVLEVIEAILSYGKSSRFYERLIRGKQVALRADANHSLTSLDPGLFFISAEALPGKDLTTLEKAINEEIIMLQTVPVPSDELSKVKNQMQASFLYGQDSVFYQAMILARHEIAATWKTIDDYLPSIRKVTADDIMRVARQYLIPENRTVGLLLPVSPPQTNKPASSEQQIQGKGHSR